MSTGPDSSQAPTRIRGPSIQDGHTATRAATANVHVEGAVDSGKGLVRLCRDDDDAF